MTALQNDERANYQLDVKFQESYLSKVVSLLQCELVEGAVSKKDAKVVDSENGFVEGGTNEIEEGELLDSHGKFYVYCCCSSIQKLKMLACSIIIKFVIYSWTS